MTTVRVRRENGMITGIGVAGHSGYAESGGDIVCAAVTSAVRLLDCALSDEMGLNVKTRVRNGGVSLKLNADDAGDRTAQVILSAFCRLTTELSQEYPENVQVMEENINA